MIRHIIVDGPDAVGKSTLADFVKKNWNMESIHSDAKCKNDFDYHSELLDENESMFYDRFMAGEYVYPKLYGRDAKLTISEMTKLFDKIIETNSLYIIMNTTDTDILIKRLVDRKEFNYLKEIQPQVELFRDFAYVFEDYFEKYDNFIYFDINQDDAYDILYDKVTKFVESCR
jgi:thymidylate kinase